MATLKNMPLLPKILIACLVLWVVYKVGTNHHHGGNDPDGPTPSPNYEPTPSANRGTTPATANEASQLLAQYETQYSQIGVQFNQCRAQMEAANRQSAMAVMNGGMPVQAPCAQNLPQWTAQAAFLEAQMYRLKTGDTKISLYDITGLRPGSAYSPSSPGSGSSGDGGLGAVERATRQGIRGNSFYTDENGEQHELPTRDYYYRDRNSGQFVGSDSLTPPDNAHDYEPLQPER